MKTYKLLLTLSFLSLGLLSSCVRDLDTEPLTDSILTPEDAWAGEGSYEQFAAKIYAGFSLSGNEGPAGMPDINTGDQGEATFIRSYWNLQQLGTDEVMGAWDNETLRGLQFNQWTSSNSFINLNYTRIYLNIAYANEFLRETTEEKLTARGVDSALASKVQGLRSEVRVLRAMSYYFLMDLYGNVPFIPEESGVGAYLPEQKDRKFLFSYIESELKEVEFSLPSNGKVNYGKVNTATAQMILAKMYLNAEVYIGEKKYTEAISALNKIIGGGFSLDPNYRDIFVADNDQSPEIIYSFVYDGRRATTYGGTTFLIAGALKSDMDPQGNFGFSQAWSGIRSKETLSDQFGENDKRALFWKQDRTRETTEWFDFAQGWSVTKFTNKKKDRSDGSSNVFADTDFPLFRLADAYLMYAEAVVRGGAGGSRSTALGYVNALRTRANAPLIGDSGLTLDFLLDERSRELYWEGHRRQDLIRYGKFTKNYAWPWKNGVYSGIATIDDKFKLYPLPSQELTANPNLKQNPGY